jgi:MinD-like ATPase involved in chromosome partitioning or flagellar assembly
VIAPVVRCLVVAADPVLGAEISALADDLPGVQLVGVIAPLRAVAGRLPPCDVALVADPGEGGAPGLRQLVAGCDRPAVVLARAAGMDTYRRALGAGARAVLPLPAVPSALGDALGEATATAAHTTTAPAGSVVAVAAAKGGAGATAIALALARLADGLLVDLSGARADLAALLGCRADRSLADLAHVGDGLAAAVETVAVTHPCGLRLVPGPAGPEIAAALPSGFAAALVRELRAAPPAVVDAGTAAFAASREAAVAADRTLVVVTPDAYSAAGGRELVTGLARWGAGTDAIAVVVNRWSRRSELSLRGITRTVGAPVVAALGNDEVGMNAFANGHARLERWPGRSHAAALREVAAELAG